MSGKRLRCVDDEGVPVECDLNDDTMAFMATGLPLFPCSVRVVHDGEVSRG